MARNSVAYDEDFFAWTQEQSRLLRAGELSLVDAENVAEELESMGRNNRRELRSRLVVLLTHFLKLQYQPHRRSRSWIATISTQRNEIELILDDSPSLRPVLYETLADAYGRARREAATQTDLSIATFPDDCPYTVDQVMAEDPPRRDQTA